jgi:hypothetical protein
MYESPVTVPNGAGPGLRAQTCCTRCLRVWADFRAATIAAVTCPACGDTRMVAGHPPLVVTFQDTLAPDLGAGGTADSRLGGVL